jgi:hypothetical protein
MTKNGALHEAWYGQRHRALRASLAARVATGTVLCARCGKLIGAGEPWDLGHRDGGGPTGYSGPEHRRCNRGSGSRRFVSSERRTSRDWFGTGEPSRS